MNEDKEIQAKEEEIMERLEAGHSLINMLNFDEHLNNVQSGKESHLYFKV